jgi:glycosyltransferase involved in cell wall biosynthesis
MRIALASIHPRLLSGQIEGLVGLAQALEQEGHNVKVVSAFPTRQLLGPDRLVLHKPRRISFDQPVRVTSILARLIRLSSDVDLIQLNLPTPAFSIFGDFLQTFVRIPVIVGFEAHLVNIRDLLSRGYWWHSPEFYLPRLLINNRILARATLHRAAHYIINTPYQKTELMSLGIPRDRLSQLPIILPSDKLTPAHHDAPISLPSGPLITYIGHYNHVKGVDTLVRAFQILAPRFPDLRLVLAWSGVGARHRVSQYLHVNDRVIELGHVRVPDLLAASTLVVLPYRLTIGQAAFPATLLEAIAANIPVVTSDLPNLRALTDNGSTAFLAPPDDPAALAQKIEMVLGNPSTVSRMLERQKHWMEQLQPQRVIKEYERLYEQIAARQAPVLCPAGDRKGI